MKLDGDFQERVARELDARIETGDLPEPLLHALRQADSAPATLASAETTELNDFEVVAQNVVNALGSPSLLIRNHSFESPLMDTWGTLLEPHRAALEAVIPSVGRIEVQDGAQQGWIGTGVLVAPTVLVTNRHVAVLMADQSAEGWSFKPGHGGATVAPRVDFRAEHEVAASAEFALVDVLAIENHDGPDLAFLRVAQGEGLPDPAGLGTSTQPYDFVAAIGYTAKEANLPPEAEEILLFVFGSIYDVKRLAPGKTLLVTAERISHDCSTLGGNSGSALVDVETGQVAGIHFDGTATENLAVPVEVVRNRLDAVA